MAVIEQLMSAGGMVRKECRGCGRLVPWLEISPRRLCLECEGKSFMAKTFQNIRLTINDDFARLKKLFSWKGRGG